MEYKQAVSKSAPETEIQNDHTSAISPLAAGSKITQYFDALFSSSDGEYGLRCPAFTLTLKDPSEYAPPHLSTCGQEQIQIPKCSIRFGIEDNIRISKTAMLHVINHHQNPYD
jgi:hypothetical protein